MTSRACNCFRGLLVVVILGLLLAATACNLPQPTATSLPPSIPTTNGQPSLATPAPLTAAPPQATAAPPGNARAHPYAGCHALQYGRTRQSH